MNEKALQWLQCHRSGDEKKLLNICLYQTLVIEYVLFMNLLKISQWFRRKNSVNNYNGYWELFLPLSLKQIYILEFRKMDWWVSQITLADAMKGWSGDPKQLLELSVQIILVEAFVAVTLPQVVLNSLHMLTHLTLKARLTVFSFYREKN